MKILLQIFDLLMENKVWPHKKPSEILTILMFLNNKGYIYTTSVNGCVTSAICAYRIKEGDSLDKIPFKEEGNILYARFCISLSKEDKFKTIRTALDLYLKDNPYIVELVLEDMNSKIKRYNLKGADNGQEQRLTVASNADAGR